MCMCVRGGGAGGEKVVVGGGRGINLISYEM